MGARRATIFFNFQGKKVYNCNSTETFRTLSSFPHANHPTWLAELADHKMVHGRGHKMVRFDMKIRKPTAPPLIYGLGEVTAALRVPQRQCRIPLS
jgi:hypothetical protein